MVLVALALLMKTPGLGRSVMPEHLESHIESGFDSSIPGPQVWWGWGRTDPQTKQILDPHVNTLLPRGPAFMLGFAALCYNVGHPQN